MQARFGSQEVSEFEKSVVEYAQGNKTKWGMTKPSADLNGEPKAEKSEDERLADTVLAAAGVNYDKKG